jgi:hypothetical protein
MTVLYYALTVLLGVVGALGVLRFVERMAFSAEGSGSPSAQLVIGLVFTLLAYKSYAKARRTNHASSASSQA